MPYRCAPRAISSRGSAETSPRPETQCHEVRETPAGRAKEQRALVRRHRDVEHDLDGVAHLQRAHQASIRSLALSGDGETLATGDADGTVRVWRVHGAHEIARATSGRELEKVALSADGGTVATGHRDGTARVFPLRADALIEAACKRVSRNLTAEEWRNYLGDEPYRKTCPSLG